MYFFPLALQKHFVVIALAVYLSSKQAEEKYIQMDIIIK